MSCNPVPVNWPVIAVAPLKPAGELLAEPFAPVPLPLAPTLVEIGSTPVAPVPAATQRPAGRVLTAPTVSRSALPSPVKSPSARGVAGDAANGASALSVALLPPEE